MQWCGILVECSNPFGSQNTEWNDFLDVYALLERLRKKQQSTFCRQIIGHVLHLRCPHVIIQPLVSGVFLLFSNKWPLYCDSCCSTRSAEVDICVVEQLGDWSFSVVHKSAKIWQLHLEITALPEHQAEAVQRLHFANNVARIRMLGSI